jgi:hypothetical protein
MDPTDANFVALERKFATEIAELRAELRHEQAAAHERRDAALAAELTEALRQSEDLLGQLRHLRQVASIVATTPGRIFSAEEMDALRYFGMNPSHAVIQRHAGGASVVNAGGADRSGRLSASPHRGPYTGAVAAMTATAAARGRGAAEATRPERILSSVTAPEAAAAAAATRAGGGTGAASSASPARGATPGGSWFAAGASPQARLPTGLVRPGQMPAIRVSAQLEQPAPAAAAAAAAATATTTAVIDASAANDSETDVEDLLAHQQRLARLQRERTAELLARSPPPVLANLASSPSARYSGAAVIVAGTTTASAGVAADAARRAHVHQQQLFSPGMSANDWGGVPASSSPPRLARTTANAAVSGRDGASLSPQLRRGNDIAARPASPPRAPAAGGLLQQQPPPHSTVAARAIETVVRERVASGQPQLVAAEHSALARDVARELARGGDLAALIDAALAARQEQQERESLGAPAALSAAALSTSELITTLREDKLALQRQIALMRQRERAAVLKAGVPLAGESPASASPPPPPQAASRKVDASTAVMSPRRATSPDRRNAAQQQQQQQQQQARDLSVARLRVRELEAANRDLQQRVTRAVGAVTDLGAASPTRLRGVISVVDDALRQGASALRAAQLLRCPRPRYESSSAPHSEGGSSAASAFAAQVGTLAAPDWIGVLPFVVDAQRGVAHSVTGLSAPVASSALRSMLAAAVDFQPTLVTHEGRSVAGADEGDDDREATHVDDPASALARTMDAAARSPSLGRAPPVSAQSSFSLPQQRHEHASASAKASAATARPAAVNVADLRAPASSVDERVDDLAARLRELRASSASQPHHHSPPHTEVSPTLRHEQQHRAPTTTTTAPPGSLTSRWLAPDRAVADASPAPPPASPGAGGAFAQFASPAPHGAASPDDGVSPTVELATLKRLQQERDALAALRRQQVAQEQHAVRVRASTTPTATPAAQSQVTRGSASSQRPSSHVAPRAAPVAAGPVQPPPPPPPPVRAAPAAVPSLAAARNNRIRSRHADAAVGAPDASGADPVAAPAPASDTPSLAGLMSRLGPEVLRTMTAAEVEVLKRVALQQQLRADKRRQQEQQQQHEQAPQMRGSYAAQRGGRTR